MRFPVAWITAVVSAASFADPSGQGWIERGIPTQYEWTETGAGPVWRMCARIFPEGAFSHFNSTLSPAFRGFCVWGSVPDGVVASLNPRGSSNGTKFQPLAVRWTTTATEGSGLGDGDAITLTYSFVPDGTIIPGDPDLGNGDQPSNLFAAFDGIYGSTAAWQSEFMQVFDRWDMLTGITYVFEPNDDGAVFAQFGVTDGAPGQLGVRGDIRIAGYTVDGPGPGGIAFSFFPNSGEIILDTANAVDFYADTSLDSLNLRNIVAHEHGHGLGMRHVCPRNDTKLMEPNLSRLFDGPQFDDILLAQKHYGDRFAGNDSVGAASSLGAVDAATIVEEFLSLADNADVDFFSIDVSSTHDIGATVTPIGGVYLSGPQNPNGSCSSGTLFNASTRLNLGVALIDSDGSTVLAQSNIMPAGGQESAVTKVGPGTYFVRVFATAGSNVQAYDLDVTGTPSIGPILRNASGGGLVSIGAGSRTLSVEVSNTVAPVSMQWFKDDVALVDGPNLSGTDTEMLTIAPLSVGDTGIYDLRVTDATAVTVRSDPITLDIIPNVPATRPLGWVCLILALPIGAWVCSSHALGLLGRVLDRH